MSPHSRLFRCAIVALTFLVLHTLIPIALAQPTVVIRPDGWTAEITFPGMTIGGSCALDADTAPRVVLDVKSPGFAVSGSATTFSREIVGTIPLRKPFPDQLQRVEENTPGGARITIALSDRIYAADTLGACTLNAGIYTSNGTASAAAKVAPSNTSTLAYTKPVANWCAVPYDRSTSGSATFPVELLAFHRHPRDARQVAAIRFEATDESGHSVAVISSTMTRSTRVKNGNPIAVYHAEIPLATLTAGDFINVRAKVYPFVGDASAVLDSDPSADGTAMPTPNLTNFTFLNDKTGAFGTVYAYVDPAGNDASGVASKDPTAAEASPFATIAASGAAIKAVNNSTFGHDDPAGGVIRLRSGTYAGFGANMDALGAGKTWLTIEGAPGTTVDGIVMQDGTYKNPSRLVKLRNLTIAATTDTWVIDGNSAGLGAFEGVHFTAPFANANPIIYHLGTRYFIDCQVTDVRRAISNSYGAALAHTPLVAGCTASNSAYRTVGWQTYTCVGNDFRNGNAFGEILPASRCTKPKGAILAFNSVYSKQTEMAFGVNWAHSAFAIVQNVFEQHVNGVSPSFTVGRDSSIKPLDNVIVQYVTSAGERTNFLYNDIGTESVPKHGVLMYCLLQQFNIKTDTFANGKGGANGNRTGNWEPQHGVGMLGNFYIQGAVSNAGPPAYVGPNSWNGAYAGRNTRIAGNPEFTNDQSSAAGNAGDGDYHIGSASKARNRVPAGQSALPFDLSGVPRLNDGTGAAGAYECVATP